MADWRLLVDKVSEHISPVLLEAGFVRKRMPGSVLAFGRESDEVVWSVVITRLPPIREPGHIAALFAELVVQSKRLHEVFAWDLMNWTLSPVRLDLARVGVFPVFDPDIDPVWRMNSESDADVAGKECARLLTNAGLKFLDQFQTDAHIAVALRVGGQHIHRGRGKATYDADVLEGLVDPKTTPFVP